MNELIIFCVLLLGQSAGAASCSAPVAQGKTHEQQVAANSQPSRGEWGAANYQGLVIGKATRADMLRVLGAPQDSGPPGDQSADVPASEEWNEYETSGELPGKLTVVVDKHSGLILGIDLYPENLSREAAIKQLGDDYVVTRYDFDSCLSKNDGESAPLYESPNGQIEVLEYRQRGIAVGVNYQGKVDQIQYVSKPIGSTSSRCKQ
jgi:hypothetical protein